jgi:diguanylate cyclase (GGDEF)-like protein
LEIFQRILGHPPNPIHQNYALSTQPLKLNALCCITAFYQNWRSTAAEYWQKLQSFILDPAALPFFYFAKAIFSKMEGNYGLAIQSLEEGIKEATMRDLPHLKFNMELEMYICYGHLHQTHNQKVVIEQIESQLPIHGSFETEKLYQHIRYGGKVENFVSQRRFNSDIRNLSINISNIAKRQATLFNLDRQEKRLKFLSHFVKEISSQYTKSQILKKGAGLIQEEFGFETFILMEDAAEKTWFKGERHHELPEEYAYRQFWSGRTKPQAKSWVSGAIRSAIFPFEAEENNQLWFYAHSTMGNKGFYSEDIDILFLAAEHWNTVLDLRNAKDHNRILVKTDYLTGINARGEILRLAEKERKRCIRYSKSRSRRFFSLLALDIDFFRQFNERHGQKEGDKLLIDTAEAFSGLIREFDSIGRIGGDEYLLVLPETDQSGACVLGERIKQSFLNLTAVQNHQKEGEPPLGISFAALQYDIEIAPSLDESLEVLSSALREIKESIHSKDLEVPGKG